MLFIFSNLKYFFFKFIIIEQNKIKTIKIINDLIIF